MNTKDQLAAVKRTNELAVTDIALIVASFDGIEVTFECWGKEEHVGEIMMALYKNIQRQIEIGNIKIE